MKHDKLNVLSSGGIKDLNYNSEGHGKFHCSQNALVPQRKNYIRTKKQLFSMKRAFDPITPELTKPILQYSEYR